jgi:HK97 family phage major capsid protein
MSSIQALREARLDVAKKVRKIIEDNPAAKWTKELSDQCERLYAQIDAYDREIYNYADMLSKEAEKGGARITGEQWRDATTGQVVPVAFAKRGKISAQLERPGRERPEAGEIGFADFVRGVAGMRSSEAIRNALSEGTDAAGGFTLPQYLQGQMLDALAPVSALLTAGAGIGILDTGAKSYRIAATSTIPSAAWRAEGGAVASSDPAFRAVDITPRSLAFQFRVSRELLMDAANMEQALYAVIAQAFAKELDRAGLRGSGTPPEIRGILNTAGIQSVTNLPNGVSLATDAYADLVTATASILGADAPMPTAAIMSPRSLTILGGLLDTTNQPRRKPPLLEKVEFVASSQIPNNLTLGSGTTCSEIYMGDFSKVAFFMREGVSVQLAKELYAGTGEVGFICHARADLAVMYPAALGVITGVLP